LNQESPALYYPMARQVWPLMDIVVRTDGAPEALVPVIRQKVHELDSELALGNVRTMEQWLSNSAAQPRLNTVLLGAFASVALLIASIGIYGVLAYSVSQRTGEIGVRMALGATPRGVLRLIVGEGMKVVLIGIGTGVVAGLTLGRTVSSLIFGVPVRDPATFTAVAVALAGVAPNGRILICDGYANARILEYTVDGKKLREWGSAGTGPGQFHLPHSIVVDKNNILLYC
jgi:putative ABC transport system permease protein